MQFCSVFSKPPVNVLSCFHNLKNKKEKEKQSGALWGEKTILWFVVQIYCAKS